MPTEAQLVDALTKADAAGDTASAQQFAGMIKQMRGQAPKLPAQPQKSDTLGLYQGAMHVLDNAATGAKFLANKVPVPGMNEGLGTAVDQLGQAMGLSSTEGAVQGHSDYIAQQAAQGRIPSARGRIAGEIAATAPTALLPGGIAAQGAIGGALTTDSKDVRGIAEDAALGAAAGKTVSYGGQLLAKAAKSVPIAPAIDALKSAARKAYQAVDSSGMIISGNAMRSLTQGIESDLAGKGVDAALHPKAIAAFNRVASAATDPKTGGNVTLQGLEVLRRVAGQAAQSTDPADKYMGRVIQEHIDNLAENLGPQHVVGNVDQNAMNALGQARSMWKSAAKADIIQKALDKAKNSASNLTQGGEENAQRVAFRQIANNQKVFARFNPDEQQAILAVVRGGPVSNLMRHLGKMAPRGVVSGGVDVLMGHALGVGAAPMMIAGEVGLAGSASATSRAADYASALVRSGGKVATQAPGYASRLMSKAVTPTRIAAPVLAVSAADQTP